ncbi:hypothetical protein CAAN1_16S01794 [[Candida] anglica]|uniref:3-hydroxyisobutyrate dehydrogenase n=1 Tax=[Candida] anglica TaxID=148631 RepID=A0ABP0EBJ5_9ASCO
MLRISAVRSFSSSTRCLTNYGFVGLGQMGQHMARHIFEKLEPHDKLYVYDTSSEAATQFVAENVKSLPGNTNLLVKVDSLEDLVHKVDAPLDFVVSMVPEGKHVKGVIKTLVEATKSKQSSKPHPTIFIDSSTIDIPTSKEVHEYVKATVPHCDFIDAPVSGGVNGARRGTLSFMLSRATHDDISPSLTHLLNKMGINIFPCGATHGTGLAAKLANNYLLAVTNLAVADSFQLAKSFGLDLNAYAKLVSVSTGKSWASVDNCPIPGVYPPENQLPADVDYNGGFITKLTRKDLVLATQCAAANNRPLFLGDISKYWYDKACESQEIANKDLAVLYKWLGELNSTKIN